MSDGKNLTNDELDALEMAHRFYPYSASGAVLKVIAEVRESRKSLLREADSLASSSLERGK